MVPNQKEGGETNQYKIITDRDENQPTRCIFYVFGLNLSNTFND